MADQVREEKAERRATETIVQHSLIVSAKVDQVWFLFSFFFFFAQLYIFSTTFVPLVFDFFFAQRAKMKSYRK